MGRERDEYRDYLIRSAWHLRWLLRKLPRDSFGHKYGMGELAGFRLAIYAYDNPSLRRFSNHESATSEAQAEGKGDEKE